MITKEFACTDFGLSRLTTFFHFRLSSGFVHGFRVADVNIVVGEEPKRFRRRRRQRRRGTGRLREAALAERARRERAAGDGFWQEDRFLPLQIRVGHGQLLQGQARHKPLDER